MAPQAVCSVGQVSRRRVNALIRHLGWRAMRPPDDLEPLAVSLD